MTDAEWQAKYDAEVLRHAETEKKLGRCVHFLDELLKEIGAPSLSPSDLVNLRNGAGLFVGRVKKEHRFGTVKVPLSGPTPEA